jgi:hypothetical protein
LALKKKKRSIEETIDKKIQGGYTISIFNEVIMKRGRTYTIDYLLTYEQEISRSLELFVTCSMLWDNVNDELLVIGSFIN